MAEKCNKTGCPNIATHRVVGEFKSAPNDTPARAEWDLLVCGSHAKVEWDDIITPESWDELRASFTGQGFAEPKKGLSRIFTERIR